MAQSILANTAVAMTGRIGTLVLGFMVVALTTRLMTVGDFGIYSLVLTITTFLQLIADFGLYLTASKELGSGEKSEIALRHIVSLRLALLVLVFTVGLISFWAIPSFRGHVPLFIIFALGLSFQSVSQLMMSVFQATGVVWRATIGDLVGRTSQVVFLFLLSMASPHARIQPLLIALTFSCGLLIAFGIHVLVVPKRGALLPQGSFSMWKKILIASWPIGALLVLNMIYFRIDTIMIAVLNGSEEVGWYSLAYKIIENTLFFPAMLGGLVLPHISSALRVGNKEHARSFVEQALLVSCSLALPAVAILTVFGNDIATLLSGPAFLPSGKMLSVLAWASGIMFIGNILGFVLIALSCQRALMKLYAVLVVGNIIGNFLLIPHFGGVGAAWVTVVTEGIATSVAAFLVYRHIQWRISYSLVIRALGSMLLALATGLLLPQSTPVEARIICICALYAIIGYYSGMWNASTLGLLRISREV